MRFTEFQVLIANLHRYLNDGHMGSREYGQCPKCSGYFGPPKYKHSSFENEGKRFREQNEWLEYPCARCSFVQQRFCMDHAELPKNGPYR